MKPPNQSYPLLTLMALSISAIAYIFGPIFWSPNQYAMMIGGDGGMLYFNMLHYVWYGEGLSLTNMNYLDPECVLMTASQASVSILLKMMSSVVPAIDNYVVGIVHVIFMLAIVLQNLCLYLVLRKVKIAPWMAALLTLCLGLLAPQLVRISYGHFGLSYPFILPLTILWLLFDRKDKWYKWLTAAYLFSILFFGFNNPYILFISVTLALSYSLIGWLLTRRRSHLEKIGWSLLIVMIVYGTIFLNDPYDDRIGQQWGHFYFASTLNGIFYDQYSLLYKGLSIISEMEPGRSETYATVSLASLLIVVLSVAVALSRGKFIKAWQTIPDYFKLLVLSSILVFVYASAFFKWSLWSSLIGEFKPLTMIKASGRLSWIVYYAFSITAAYLFYQLWRYRGWQKWKPLLLLFPLLWLFEGFTYVKDHVKAAHYDDPFNRQHLMSYRADMASDVDFDEYQAILTIPVFQSWNDNLLVESEWTTQLHAQSISLASDLPWINSRLSRAPVGRSLQNVQLTSHPLIKRDLVSALPQDLPVLLVKGSTHDELSEGESILLSKAEHLYHSENIDLYKIYPQQLDHPEVRRAYLDDCDLESEWHYRLSFDDLDNQCGFQSAAGRLLSTEFENITSLEIPVGASGTYELSFWNQVNIEKYGMPNFNVLVKDSSEREVYREYIDSRNYTDNQYGWLRTSIELELKEFQTLELEGRGRYAMCMDEILLKRVDVGPVCYPIGEGKMSVDNYMIDLQDERVE